MKLRETILAAAFILGSAAIPSEIVFGQTTVGIHATQAEVAIWKQRAVDGPYKEGWDTVKSRADAFVSNPEPRWPGKTGNACYDQDVDSRPGRNRDRGLRDAGLAYLVTGNNSYRDAIRNALLAQTYVTGTDFINPTRWCLPTSGAEEQEVANWVRRLVYGYSFIRETLPTADRLTLDNWFLGAGLFYHAHVHRVIVGRFPNRLSNSYSICSSSEACPGSNEGLLYFGGPMSWKFSRPWANKPSAQAAMIAAIGIVINNANLKAGAKRFFEEWMKFAVWPSGEVFDQNRWDMSPINPQVAYSYAGTAIGAIVSIADHFARAGDTSLYEFSTSEGMYGTQGGPKSLLKVLQHFAGLTNETKIQYSSNTATTNSQLRIDPFGSTENRILYLVLAPANIYYRRADLKIAYTTPLPTSWKTGGYDGRGGDWGSYSDLLFMFGRLEDVVWPYPTGVPSTPPLTAPTQLIISP